MNLFLKYLLAWFPMLILAIFNGTLRDLGYKKYVGDLVAHQLSTFSLLLLLGLYMSYIINKYPPQSAQQALGIGIFWMSLTLLFEFGFGRYRGNSWEALLADYNLAKGRLWVLIPTWLASAPYLFFHYFIEGIKSR
jgi:hypothetical protein